MYDRVLVPTDGSEGSRAAVEHAVDLARTFDAVLHVLSVVDADVGVDGAVVGTLDAFEAAGEDAVDEVARRAAAAGVETVTDVREGTPHRALLDYADEHAVDLVVMGTHGRTGLDRYLLGSVAERVVRLSDVPVLTVRIPEDASEEDSGSDGA
jgi:nucleotide-binding universal stress UspA family protein